MLNFFFGPKSPTRGWPPHAGEPLMLDLDRATLNRVGLGRPLSAYSFLGPDDRPGAGTVGEFYYHQLGVAISSYASPAKLDDPITEIRLVFLDPDQPKQQPYRGRATWGGADVDLATQTPASFVEQFGTPYWQHLAEDDDEVMLFYERGGVEWQVEFAERKHLSHLTLTNQPLFDDPDQRRLWGLDKPWPPAATPTDIDEDNDNQ